MTKERHKNVPASYLVLIKDNKILLLKRFNTGYKDGFYSMVAGHVDPDESFSTCIIREAYEEAGIILQPQDISAMHMMHRKSCLIEKDRERVDVFFIAKKWEGEIENKEPHKCDDLSWFDLDNIPENTIPFIKEVIKHYQNNTHYSEFGWDQVD